MLKTEGKKEINGNETNEKYFIYLEYLPKNEMEFFWLIAAGIFWIEKYVNTEERNGNRI